jgi:tetratricopeptide (TPR) repeat protein
MAGYRLILLVAGVGLVPSAALAFPPEAPKATCASLDTAPSDDPAEEYNRAAKALDTHCYAVARKAIEGVLASSEGGNPVFLAEANYIAGRSAAGLKDYPAARTSLEKAVGLNKNLIPAQRELAIVYARMGERAKAQAQLAVLNELQKSCGAGCAQAKEIGSAVSAVKAELANPARAQIETQPSLIFAGNEAGERAYVEAVGLINEHRYEEAIVSLETSLKATGSHPDILTYLGFANRNFHRYDAAEAYYRAALAMNPQHRGATEYYGELMVERGDTKGAKVMLARLETSCTFGCAEADELRRWIDGGPRAAR